jgi:hypothetical protein
MLSMYAVTVIGLNGATSASPVGAAADANSF